MKLDKIKRAASNARWRAANKAKISAKYREYRVANKEKIAVRGRVYYIANREKIKAARVTYCAKNREKVLATKRASHFLGKYGLTVAQKQSLLDRQGGRCPICTTTAPGKRGWVVDHNHATGKVRGLLCHPCNTGIGMLGDSAARLDAGAAYLRKGEAF